VLYLACCSDLAVKEFEKDRDVTGLRVSKPGLCSSIRIKLSRVLDLTDSKTRREIGVTLEQLRSEGWDVTQEVGEAARLAGCEGIRYPSAVDPSLWNLVVFEENCKPGAVKEIARDDHWPSDSSEAPARPAVGSVARRGSRVDTPTGARALVL